MAVEKRQVEAKAPDYEGRGGEVNLEGLLGVGEEVRGTEKGEGGGCWRGRWEGGVGVYT